MRDFRNAKAMAQTLRSALVAEGVKITVSQSLEMIAAIFGLADWNTLAATIRREKPVSREKVSPAPQDLKSKSVPPLSTTFAATQRQALSFATQRKHEYATLEHLLLALLDDADASSYMRAWNVDFGALTEKLVDYLDNGLGSLVTDTGADPRPTAAFQRVVQRAALRGQELARATVTGANALEAIFFETRSPAALLLGEQGMKWHHLQQSLEAGTKIRR